MNLTEALIARTRRVPLPSPVTGDGAAVTRQLDAALVSAGFKLSRGLFEELSSREAGQVLEIGGGALAAARKLAGDHVQHNPYFRDFPFNVPATLEFWAGLIERALAENAPIEVLAVRTTAGADVAVVNLLSLPGYGTVQHTFADMLAAHEALAASAGDRVTLLHQGGPGRAVLPRGGDRRGGPPAHDGAGPVLPLAGPAAAVRRPGGRRGDHGPGHGAGGPGLGPGAAVGAGALPEPGHRRQGPAADLHQPGRAVLGDAGDAAGPRPRPARYHDRSGGHEGTSF